MAVTTQTIQNFYRIASLRDFARDFQFRVLSLDPGDGSTIEFDENDFVYATTANLPARAITNVPVPYMGLQFNVPGSATYPGSDSYSMTCYTDQASKIRQKFEDMSREIFDEQTSTGNYYTPTRGAVMTLVQLDNALNDVAIYNLVGVSIRNVGELTYNMASGTGTIVNFTSQMAYHYFQRYNSREAARSAVSVSFEFGTGA